MVRGTAGAESANGCFAPRGGGLAPKGLQKHARQGHPATLNFFH